MIDWLTLYNYWCQYVWWTWLLLALGMFIPLAIQFWWSRDTKVIAWWTVPFALGGTLIIAIMWLHVFYHLLIDYYHIILPIYAIGLLILFRMDYWRDNISIKKILFKFNKL